MDRLDIFLPVCICMMLVAVVVIQHLRYRTVMKEKNYAVFHQIKEQTRLARELEQTRTEKETLEKLVIERINPTPKPPSPSGLPPQGEEPTLSGQGSTSPLSSWRGAGGEVGSTCQDNRREVGTSHQQGKKFTIQ